MGNAESQLGAAGGGRGGTRSLSPPRLKSALKSGGRRERLAIDDVVVDDDPPRESREDRRRRLAAEAAPPAQSVPPRSSAGVALSPGGFLPVISPNGAVNYVPASPEAALQAAQQHIASQQLAPFMGGGGGGGTLMGMPSTYGTGRASPTNTVSSSFATNMATARRAELAAANAASVASLVRSPTPGARESCRCCDGAHR